MGWGKVPLGCVKTRGGPFLNDFSGNRTGTGFAEGAFPKTAFLHFFNFLTNRKFKAYIGFNSNFFATNWH